MKILVVEDDRALADMLKVGLGADAHTVELTHDGADGSFLGRSYDYDAVILDYSLPKKNGLTVCEEMRSAGRLTPIIFLSMSDDIPIKIAAFKSGADDYVTKPFSIEELRARVRAVARRPSLVENHIRQVADLILDSEKQNVTRGETRIRLTKKELNLLEYMMRHTGAVLSRAMIMEHVWTAESDLLSNTVEAHIRNLRRKLNVKNKPDLIANIQGRGYVIDTPENLRRMLVN